MKSVRRSVNTTCQRTMGNLGSHGGPRGLGTMGDLEPRGPRGQGTWGPGKPRDLGDHAWEPKGSGDPTSLRYVCTGSYYMCICVDVLPLCLGAFVCICLCIRVFIYMHMLILCVYMCLSYWKKKRIVTCRNMYMIYTVLNYREV